MGEDRGDKRSREFAIFVGDFEENGGSRANALVIMTSNFVEHIDASGAVQTEHQRGTVRRERSEPSGARRRFWQVHRAVSEKRDGLSVRAVAGKLKSAAGEKQTEWESPAFGCFRVKKNCDPRDHGVCGAVSAKAAEYEKLDTHEHGRARRQECEQCPAFGTVGDDNRKRPEQRAVITDGKSEDGAVAAVNDRMAAARTDARQRKLFQQTEVKGEGEAERAKQSLSPTFKRGGHVRVEGCEGSVRKR